VRRGREKVFELKRRGEKGCWSCKKKKERRFGYVVKKRREMCR